LPFLNILSVKTALVIYLMRQCAPVHEANRLVEDLDRACIAHTWWVINSSFAATNTTNKLLQARAHNEARWIKQVADISHKHFVVIKWHPEDISGKNLANLFNE
jgi:arsenite-transporting ATPase